MSTDCPDIEALLTNDSSAENPQGRSQALVAEALAHAEICEACRAVRVLAVARRASFTKSQRAPTTAPTDRAEAWSPVASVRGRRIEIDPISCARVEAQIAGVAEGRIDARSERELSLHLAACETCSELMARVTSAKDALELVPDPVWPEAVSPEVASPKRSRADRRAARENDSAREWSNEGAQMASTGLHSQLVIEKDPTVNRGWLGRIVPPRSHRVAWIIELAVAAAAAGLLIHGLERTTARGDSEAQGFALESAEPLGRSTPTPGAGSNGLAGDEAQKLAMREKELGETRERVTSAEERIRSLEDSLRLLTQKGSEAPKVTPVPLHDDAAPKPPIPTQPTPVPTPPLLVVPPPFGGATGSMSIVCSPFCDDVVVDGQSWGPTPIIRHVAPEGQHRVSLRKNGAPPRTMSIQVKSGELSMVRADMSPGTPVDPFQGPSPMPPVPVPKPRDPGF